jgi:S-adenosylmethionine-diacylglycerol 3-amino-3-carboxypropyl transferase
MSEFARAADLETLRYGQVWEDHRLVEDGLAVAPDDDVLAIASAGCNVLHLLLAGARTVTAVDLSVAQLALLELKLAAIARLRHDEVVTLVGLRDGDRASLYARLRPHLSERAAAYWDARPDALARGPVHAGRLESYFRSFQKDALATLVDREELARFLQLEDLSQQKEAFQRLFDRPDFEAAIRTYYGRENMAREGRDPSQFAFVEAMDVGGFFWSRFRWVCTSLPARGNPYLEFFLTSGYRDLERSLGWLQPASFERLRELLPRVSLELAEIGAVLRDRPPGSFSKALLSDVFEYMSSADSEALFDLLAERTRAGGRFCYWNLLVPRASPPRLSRRLEPLAELSGALWRRDRSFFYRAFHVERIR